MFGSKNYKLKSIKVFGSKENLYYNTKIYRKVYDESECDYLYCELAFYNLKFNKKEWNTKIRFICRNTETKKEICDFDKELLVKKDMDTVHVREGWGTIDSGWWVKGSYSYEVFIDGKSVGTTYFYVTDKGIVSQTENPYFEIKEINLFEGPKRGVLFPNRAYKNVFEAKTSKYINIEMHLLNLQTELDSFPLELQFNAYKNDSGSLKFHVSYFKEIMDSREEIIMDTGYGSDGGGYFYEGVYRMECVFMGIIIATVPFKMISDFNETEEAMENNDTPHSANINIDPEEEEADSIVGNLTVILKVPKELNNAFLQYLSFFEDYIRVTKGKEIPLYIRKSINGLELELKHNDRDYTIDEVNSYVNEYTGFLSSNIGKEIVELPAIEVENDSLNENQFNSLVVELKSEIDHFKNKYEFAQDKIMLLEERTKELKDDKKYLKTIITTIKFEENSDTGKNDKIYLKKLITKLAYNKLFKLLFKMKLENDKVNDLVHLKSSYSIIKRKESYGDMKDTDIIIMQNKLNSSLINFVEDL